MRLLDARGGEALPDGFLDLPALVYGDDLLWIREDPAEVAALFSPANPWFAAGRAHAFCVPGLARAAAFRADGLEVDDVPAAFFGYWETTGDAGAEAQVMRAVRSWARRAGARRLYGPIDFSTMRGNRVRLDGAGEAPYAGEPYNPPGYAAGLEALGLEMCRRYVSHDMDAADVRALAEYSRPLLAELGAQGYRFSQLDAAAWHAHTDELFVLANEVFSANFAFTPLRRAEFDAHFGAGWVARLDPELSVLAHGPEGDVAGICLTYPHDGPLEVLFKTGGVGPAHRGSGLAHVLAGEVARRAAERGVTRMLIGPMREDNASRHVFRHGHRAQRWYGLFAADLS